MIPVFVDTSVLLHATGGPHPLRAPAQELLRRATHDLVLHIGAETVQEFVFHKARFQDRAAAAELGEWLLQACVVHPFDDVVARRGLELVTQTRSLGGRDAFLAATALGAGFSSIVVHDGRFQPPPGLAPLTAEQFLATLP